LDAHRGACDIGEDFSEGRGTNNYHRRQYARWKGRVVAKRPSSKALKASKASPLSEASVESLEPSSFRDRGTISRSCARTPP
jgi:hypothetical protein